MGNTYITAKALLDDLGLEYIIPPFSVKKALEIGTKYAPEFACLPLKINLGNFIQAYQQGADTILITGGRGPCRFGYYCEMHREILRDNGYDMDVIALEVPNGDLKEFFRRIKKLAGTLNIHKLCKIAANVTLVAKMVDELESFVFRTRPRELEKGSTDKIYGRFLKDVMKVKGSAEIMSLVKKTIEEISRLNIDNTVKPFKIGIVGEIYTTIDINSSFEIESKLGSMGAEIHRPVNVSGWIIEHIIKHALHLPRNLRYAEAAKPYLGTMIGGHAQETVGNTVLFAKDGFDGVIQIYPLTCMPEIVAQSILPAIERDFDIPILTLIIDEMTGEAGCYTRLEAFMDLLQKRRERKEAIDKEEFNEKNMLFGN